MGIELILIGIGGPILAAAAGAGLPTLGLTAAGAGLGALGAGATAAVAATGLGSAGALANPHIGNGVHNAVMETYNNATTGSANAVNGLNIPGIPHIGPF